MLGHILIMNCFAPLVVLAVGAIFPVGLHQKSPRWISAATAAQIATLWFWHLPPAMNWAMQTSAGFALMSVSLAIAALWFWKSVIDCAVAAAGRSLLSLLVTGKLFCLLGILLAFAPRPIYEHAVNGFDRLADQQLAGLLMLVSCPLTYVLAAIVIAARWLAELEAKGAG
jgi:putative membrane protein